VRGGAKTVVGALRAGCGLVVMPTFTYQCLIRPAVGPEHNGTTYGDFYDENAQAEIFRPDLPAHADMSIVAETLRRSPDAHRSSHPVLSFAAVGAGAAEVVAAQSLDDPLGPIAHLTDQEGEVLLLGVSHIFNTAIHHAERRAGRKTFVRWALTARGVVPCPHWPGDSAGFDAITPHTLPFARTVQIGQARVQRLPLRELIRVAEDLIRADPTALLCRFSACERCNAVRASLPAVIPT
jgi:aminoglycoside 3-N-acetyltransferase